MEYNIHQTRRGDFAVCVGRTMCHDPRTGDEARFASPEEAHAWIDARHAEETEIERIGAERRAFHEAMAQRAPELVARQLRWQAERRAFHEEVRRAEKESAHLAAKPISPYGLANPRYGGYQRSKQDRSAEYAAELRHRYEQACLLDAQIKAAYTAGDLAAWAAALTTGETLLGYQHGNGDNDVAE